MWVPAHLADIESDMSAVHRVDDIRAAPGPRVFRLAWRLPHYRGVMRDRVIGLQEDREDAPAPAVERPAARPAAADRAAPVTEAALADPVMSRIFSFG